ncbi:MAG TPA: STAS domain-containing protein [Bacillales bacterium]|nr:STAS domain-containing protein [Bacillales bacterium]
MDLQISHKTVHGVDTLSVSGEIDAYTAPQLRNELLPLAQKEGAAVAVDLSRVEYMDSTGLGVFVAALKYTKKHGGRIKITGPTPRVKRLFDITGLAEIIDIDREVKGGTS